jgi:hypothetical protein
MPRFHYESIWKEMMRPGPRPRACENLGCNQIARRGSAFCVWCDPKATEEEKRAADLALEPPWRRRRRWAA